MLCPTKRDLRNVSVCMGNGKNIVAIDSQRKLIVFANTLHSLELSLSY